MNAARRTLGTWIFAAFLERGCDPATARRPGPVFSVRSLTVKELAALHPFQGRLHPVHNLLRFPARRQRRAAPPVC